VQAYNKETTPSGVGVGAAGGVSNNLCPSSTGSIPAAIPVNQKFTVPPTGAGSYGIDPGFGCLGFQMNQPQYFAYDYTLGGGSLVATGAIGLMAIAPTGWATGAGANFDGTNTVQFATGGNLLNNTPVTSTSIQSFDSATSQAF
jgi:hypothetical protein